MAEKTEQKAKEPKKAGEEVANPTKEEKPKEEALEEVIKEKPKEEEAKKVVVREPKTCITCGEKSGVYVSFPCPSCTEQEIVRCVHCRSINKTYICPKCGFEGP